MFDRMRGGSHTQPVATPGGCVDLQASFGHMYRLGHDPAYFAEHGERGRAHDPWLLAIPCRHGEIYPHGGELLAFASKGRGPIANTVARLSGAVVVQDADDGLTVTFPVDLFDQVAAIVKPKRRRYLSPEQRAACAERLAKHRPEALRQAAEKRAKIAPSPDLAPNTTPPLGDVPSPESPP